MKKRYLALMFVLVVLCMGAYLQTYRQSIVVYRSAVIGATDDALAAARKWDARPQAKLYKLPGKWNEFILTPRGSAEDITCVDMEVWGYPGNSTAIHFWTGSITAGAILDNVGTYHADTITTIKDNSPSGALISDGGGEDGVGTISFDGRRVEYVLVLFPTISAGSWNCDINGD